MNALAVATPRRRLMVALAVLAAAEGQARVYPLRGLVPDQALEESLRAFLPRTQQFVVDRERRLLIVSGNERATASLENFLRQLEQARERPAPRALRVRVAWLA